MSGYEDQERLTLGLAVSVPRAAALLGIGQKLAWRYVMSGELRSAKLDRRRVIPIEELRAFLQRRMAATRPIPSSQHGIAGRHAGRPAGGHAGGSGEPVHVDDDDEENL
jgi:hypothetical protein